MAFSGTSSLYLHWMHVCFPSASSKTLIHHLRNSSKAARISRYSKMQQNADFVVFKPEAHSWPRFNPCKISPNKSNKSHTIHKPIQLFRACIMLRRMCHWIDFYAGSFEHITVAERHRGVWETLGNHFLNLPLRRRPSAMGGLFFKIWGIIGSHSVFFFAFQHNSALYWMQYETAA